MDTTACLSPSTWVGPESSPVPCARRPLSTSPGAVSDSTQSLQTSPGFVPPTPLTDVDCSPVAPSHTPVGADTPARVSKRFPCDIQGCSVTFGSNKDLNRHRNTLHAGAPNEGFRCRCGKLDKRKDNYIRHCGTLSRPCHKPAQLPFRCYCGLETRSHAEHLEHVSQWTPSKACCQ